MSHRKNNVVKSLHKDGYFLYASASLFKASRFLVNIVAAVMHFDLELIIVGSLGNFKLLTNFLKTVFHNEIVD